MGGVFFHGKIPMISFFMKTVFLVIFLLSAFGKIYHYNDTLVYFAGITKISLPVLSPLLWILILLEVVIPVLIWINGSHSNFIFGSALFLLITFLIMNILFLVYNVESCGCFGTGIVSSPISGIIKTILLIVILSYLRIVRPNKDYSLSS